MSRQQRTALDVQRRIEQERFGNFGRGKYARGRQGLDFMEVLTAVLNEFVKGCTASEISRRLNQRGIPMSREEPYEFISYAARHGWLEFVPPIEHELTARLRERAPHVQELEVVHTSSFEDVASRGADTLVRLVQKCVRSGGNRDRGVHIGFAGGHAMRKLAREFAQRLRRALPDMPEVLVFHALVAGFNIHEPGTNPNAFFTYFEDDPSIQVQTAFVCLMAPPMATSTEKRQIDWQPSVRGARTLSPTIDIIVTSAGDWNDSDNTLREYLTLSNAADDIARLDDAGTVADMLWQPLGYTAPITAQTTTRALTVVTLEELSARIRQQGTRVLLCLGPCLKCHRSKEEVLRAALGQTEPLITDLVTDSISARRYLDRATQPRVPIPLVAEAGEKIFRAVTACGSAAAAAAILNFTPPPTPSPRKRKRR